jgi:molybdopterin-guanine dinucleotide biosynthesis protein A
MDVILTAGGTSRPKDPLYPLTGGGYKAMLDINGKPMIQYVLDALNACDKIERIIMVGLPPDNLLESAKMLSTLEDHGDMVANILAGARELIRLDPAATYALIVSSDIPSVTGSMIDWVIERVQESDDEIFYNVIERKVMEARFPNSRRTYVHLKNLDLCGGDLNAVRLSIASSENPLWDRLIEARKSPLRQAALIGYDTLFLLLLGRLSLDEAAKAVSRRIGIRARAILCPYAELGMDVDKPFQLEIMRKDLAGPNA